MPKTDQILTVDLDGTLIRTDMLHETFWSAFSRDWQTPFRALRALFFGKAALKAFLSGASEIDVTRLPYNDVVIDYIKTFRASGGRTILATACNQDIAQDIAGHLTLFDEVHGSDASHNLKGQNKALFLSSRFGEKSFIYIGDAHADLPVWKQASKAVTINAGPNLRKSVERINPEFEHLGTPKERLTSYLKAVRPHQWLKNSLVFAPALAAHQLESATLIQSLIAFFAFSLIASSVYITNDLLDLSADRAHPRKRQRPFASGAIPIQHGALLALGLFLAGILTAFLLKPVFLLALLTYYVLTSVYSLFLKRKTIIDICTLAGLYTMRIIGGGAATDITLSFWLLAFSIFIFLSLAAIKRQAELVDLKEQGSLQAKGRGYHVDDLPLMTMIVISAGFMAILVLMLYVNSASVIALYPTPSALWGVCCILLYWLARMAFITHRGRMHDDPIIFSIKDKVSQLCFALITALVVIGAAS
ncbi:UbiA family prenyltransferase [Pseudomonadales bacterium]|nr:UbiA family prenyltransferase [Pseudomonadales bacterium]